MVSPLNKEWTAAIPTESFSPSRYRQAEKALENAGIWRDGEQKQFFRCGVRTLTIGLGRRH
jgi:hypothetical protein